jgi:hypothetical protein
MAEISKINKQLNHNSGFVNNQNELVLMKIANILLDKVDELVDEVNSLKKKIETVEGITHP